MNDSIDISAVVVVGYVLLAVLAAVVINSH